MNWKKLLLYTGLSAAIPSLDTWLQHPVAFTFGNVGLPILGSLFTTLAALFTQPPHNDSTASGQTTNTLAGPPK